MTADQYRRDPSVSPRRREAARRLLLTEDEMRAEDAEEEASLREQWESDSSEVRPTIV